MNVSALLPLPNFRRQTLNTAMNDFDGQIVSPSWLFSVAYYLGFHPLGQHYRWGGLSDLRLGQAIFCQFNI